MFIKKKMRTIFPSITLLLMFFLAGTVSFNVYSDDGAPSGSYAVLAIYKNLVGELPPTLDQNMEFEFTVRDSAGKVIDPDPVKVQAGSFEKIELPYGGDFTIEEKNGVIQDYTLNVTADGKVTFQQKSTDTNTMEASGTIPFDGDLSGKKITVKSEDGSEFEVNGNKFSLEAGSSTTKTLYRGTNRIRKKIGTVTIEDSGTGSARRSTLKATASPGATPTVSPSPTGSTSPSPEVSGSPGPDSSGSPAISASPSPDGGATPRITPSPLSPEETQSPAKTSEPEETSDPGQEEEPTPEITPEPDDTEPEETPAPEEPAPLPPDSGEDSDKTTEPDKGDSDQPEEAPDPSDSEQARLVKFNYGSNFGLPFAVKAINRKAGAYPVKMNNLQVIYHTSDQEGGNKEDIADLDDGEKTPVVSEPDDSEKTPEIPDPEEKEDGSSDVTDGNKPEDIDDPSDEETDRNAGRAVHFPL